MKIEKLKVYDLADSIMASSFPMSIDLEDSEKRINVLGDYLRNYV